MGPHQDGCIAINFTEFCHLSAHYNLGVAAAAVKSLQSCPTLQCWWYILGWYVKFTRKPSKSSYL